MKTRIGSALFGLVIVAVAACAAEPAQQEEELVSNLTTPAIVIDQIVLHDDSNVQNNTIPPGVDGLLWCHMVGTASYEDLAAFLDSNPSIGQPSSNIRRPIDGSFVTYVGLTPDMRDAAIAAGASPQRVSYVFTHAFDYAGQDPAPTTYEP
jgi:hypothetical protein